MIKTYRAFATPILFAALSIAATPLYAQTGAETVVVPIVVGKLLPKKKPPTPGTWIKVQVIRVDANSMIVSEQDNERMIHTFNYSDDLKPKVQKIIDAGGYQYGDKIKVLVAPGNVVVTKIDGKPSKPL